MEQPKPANLLAEQRQSVREKPCVPPAHALNPHARGAEGRRRRGDVQPAHFPQQVHHVARSLHYLFLDFLGVQHFHAHRDIFDSLICAGRRDGNVFFDRRATVQPDDDRLLLVGLQFDGRRCGREPILDDHNVGMTGRQGDDCDALCVGFVRCPVHEDIRLADRTILAPDLNTQRRALRPRRRCVQREQHTQQEGTHHHLHPENEPADGVRARRRTPHHPVACE